VDYAQNLRLETQDQIDKGIFVQKKILLFC